MKSYEVMKYESWQEKKKKKTVHPRVLHVYAYFWQWIFYFLVLPLARKKWKALKWGDMRPFRGKKWKKIIIIIQLSKKKNEFFTFPFYGWQEKKWKTLKWGNTHLERGKKNKNKIK
jgi:hypothetical protein